MEGPPLAQVEGEGSPNHQESEIRDAGRHHDERGNQSPCDRRQREHGPLLPQIGGWNRLTIRRRGAISRTHIPDTSNTPIVTITAPEVPAIQW